MSGSEKLLDQGERNEDSGSVAGYIPIIAGQIFECETTTKAIQEKVAMLYRVLVDKLGPRDTIVNVSAPQVSPLGVSPSKKPALYISLALTYYHAEEKQDAEDLPRELQGFLDRAAAGGAAVRVDPPASAVNAIQRAVANADAGRPARTIPSIGKLPSGHVAADDARSIGERSRGGSVSPGNSPSGSDAQREEGQAADSEVREVADAAEPKGRRLDNDSEGGAAKDVPSRDPSSGFPDIRNL